MMFKQSFLRLGAWIAVLPVLFLPSQVFADTAGPLGKSITSLDTIGSKAGVSQGSSADLPSFIGNILNVLFGAFGIILVVYIVYAGILYMTASGEEEKVKKAKKIIMQTIIGIVLIIAAYSISNFVINQIQNAAK